MALLRLLLAAGIAVVLAGEASAEEVSLKAATDLARRTVAVGDTFRLNLDLEWKEGVQVKPLALVDRLGDFTVRDLRYGPISENGIGYARRVSVLLTVFETGEQTIPSVSIIFTDPEGSTQKIDTTPETVFVESVLPEDATDIRDIKDPISVPKRWKDLILSYALLIGLAAGTAASVLFSVRRRGEIEAFLVRMLLKFTRPLRAWVLWLLTILGIVRRKGARAAAFDISINKPDLVPEDAAMMELDRIQALGLRERGMIKEHYSLVSETMRRYLERKYRVLAMESPTSFTLAMISGLGISDEALHAIREPLEEADLVKFAKFVPGAESIGSLIDRARAVVDLTRTVSVESHSPGWSR